MAAERLFCFFAGLFPYRRRPGALPDDQLRTQQHLAYGNTVHQTVQQAERTFAQRQPVLPDGGKGRFAAGGQRKVVVAAARPAPPGRCRRWRTGWLSRPVQENAARIRAHSFVHNTHRPSSVRRRKARTARWRAGKPAAFPQTPLNPACRSKRRFSGVPIRPDAARRAPRPPNCRCPHIRRWRWERSCPAALWACQCRPAHAAAGCRIWCAPAPRAWWAAHPRPIPVPRPPAGTRPRSRTRTGRCWRIPYFPPAHTPWAVPACGHAWPHSPFPPPCPAQAGGSLRSRPARRSILLKPCSPRFPAVGQCLGSSPSAAPPFVVRYPV